ncbi:hypothetical protein BN946_scf184917.g16 [Trametes cinnabarina]|uniref:HD domain-containing protein n=1 Tax=Pycnoporus cinnabarinus TaxID=5643 RepID=A0A060SPN4_PYCCI|nr:hypothetical protein BN946_scf184917.g16 [Trametes cinnabarina]
MYRMAILSMCTSDPDLDVSKCVMMALVHDLAEAQVGDIAPREGIPKAEKRRLEAVTAFIHIHDEYEEGESKEAKFVKDLDRFEMACQASEYERNHGAQTLQPFFDSSLPFIRHPEVREWGQALYEERSKSRNDDATTSAAK